MNGSAFFARPPVADALVRAPGRGGPCRDRLLVLVALDWRRAKDPRLPLGHASLAAAVAETEQVDLIHGAFSVTDDRNSPARIASAILAACSDLPASRVDVALGVYAWNEGWVCRVLALVRQGGFCGRILLGGPQISFAPGGLEERYPEADIFVRGPGERVVVALVLGQEPCQIEGVHRAGSPDQEQHSALDVCSLPSPFLTGVLPLEVPFQRWESQRGCPFSCAFCQHRQPGARTRLSAFSAARQEAEVRLFCKAGVRDIAVIDPLFDGARALRLLGSFRRHGYSGRLSVQCRFERIDEAFLEACRGLDIRLEFGLQTLNPQAELAIGRRNRVERVEAVIRRLRDLGFTYEVSVIYGLPEQTLDSFRETLDRLLRWRVPTIKAFPLLLLRGTALDRDRKRWSLVEDEAPVPKVISSDSFSRADWVRMDALAGALQASEGQHPPSIMSLERMVRELLHRPSSTSREEPCLGSG